MRHQGWTPEQLPRQDGRVALVTGANSGIGLETVVGLARLGARVLLACRSPERGEAALGEVRARVEGADVEVRRLDLADLADVRRCADDVRADHPRLDLLVNNAGVMAPTRRRLSADGHELQLATNHLGHAALTGLLLPALLAPSDRPSRVVTVTSQAHRGGRIDLADLDAERGYQPWRAYAQSKLANLLFTMQLQRASDAAGPALLSVAAHPGFAATALVRNGPAAGRLLGPLAEVLTRLTGQSAEAGAWPTLCAAAADDVRGAELYGPSGPGGWRGYPARTSASALAYDPDLALALWERTERLTGVTLDLAPAADL
ncbi:oxidoreductase [Angustibacter peucedani]